MKKKTLSPRLHRFAAIAIAVGLLSPLQSALAQVSALDLVAQAPGTYVVQSGDTLWHVAGKFLNSPWKWPQVWGVNKAQIKNPHLIYPGDVIQLTLVNGQASLSLVAPGHEMNEVRLKPGIRFDDVISRDDAITPIAMGALNAFLIRPMLIEPGSESGMAKVTSSESGRLFSGAGSRLYASGLPQDAKGVYSVYRRGSSLVDPSGGATLALEAIHLGSVRVIRPGELALLEVVSANQEITTDDMLIPEMVSDVRNTQMAPVAADFSARVIKLHEAKSGHLLAKDGVGFQRQREGGASSVIVINKGSDSAVANGQVISLSSAGAMIGGSNSFGFKEGERVKDPIKLPDELNGHAVVFKTFRKVAYALVMSASRPVKRGDAIGAP